MAISATSSGAAIAGAIRSQYQEQFANLKRTYQETGSIAGAETAYKSDDGNVALSLRGYKTSDGREAVEVSFSTAGAEGAALQRLLTGGIDNTTGRPFSPDTQLGGPAMNASEVVDDAADFDALAQKFAAASLATPDMQNLLIQNWGLGDGSYTQSLEKYQADGRLSYAVHDAVNAMTEKMTFKSSLEKADFTAKTETALLTALRQGRKADITGVLQGVPDDALDAANKSLDASEKRDVDSSRLIKTLTDFIAESKALNKTFAQQRKTDFFA
jgi:hypothetical protein